jgi:hypothetical protein
MNTKVLNTVEDRQELEYIAGELDKIRDGLEMLGLKQCSCCRKYFKCPDGKNLLSAGQLVCYRCVSGWWEQRSPKISIEERNAVERQLLRWLMTYHGAKVIRRLSHMPATEEIELKMVVGCGLCNGTGKSGNAKCQNCDGRGSEWVVVVKPKLAA